MRHLVSTHQRLIIASFEVTTVVCADELDPVIPAATCPRRLGNEAVDRWLGSGTRSARRPLAGSASPGAARASRKEGRPRPSLLALVGCCDRSGCGVGERASEDVAVAEGGPAVVLRLGVGDGAARLDRGPPGVDRRAVGRVAGVVPDRHAVVVGRRRVDVVAEELEDLVVLARPSRVAHRPSVDLGPVRRRPPAPTSAWRTTPTSPLGVVVSFSSGVVNALYTRYRS